MRTAAESGSRTRHWNRHLCEWLSFLSFLLHAELRIMNMRFRGEHSQTAAAPGHEHSARDDIGFKIPVWLSRPRAGEQGVHVAFPAVAPPGQEEPGRPQSHERVIGDSPPPRAFDQASLRPMDAPIEADTVSFFAISSFCMRVITPGRRRSSIRRTAGSLLRHHRWIHPRPPSPSRRESLLRSMTTSFH